MVTSSAAPSALSELQIRLGYAFRQIGLLQQALTHRSFSADHYERLEFLGDALLGFVIARAIVLRFTRTSAAVTGPPCA